MHKMVLLQLAATFVTAAVASTLFGVRGFFSAIWGGLAYVVPGVFFAWRLWLTSLRGEHAKVTTFMAGELVRLISTVGLLALAVMLYKNLHWGAFLIGLALTVKANLFAFLVKTRT
ncbi:MAG: ATP synthase subunit I [Proteobacteria bacterium]|jgi:ATP synthase protein I|nr:ATP synthase subunit I [Pseudomonadota bacterium]